MSNQSEYIKNWRKKNAEHLREYNKKYNEEHRNNKPVYFARGEQ